MNLLITLKALCGLAPDYNFRSFNPLWNFVWIEILGPWSSVSSRLRTKRDSDFAIRAARCWNELPGETCSDK